MPPVRIGTVDLPERLERERYFRELSYLELSALFAGPLKAAALAKWAQHPSTGVVDDQDGDDSGDVQADEAGGDEVGGRFDEGEPRGLGLIAPWVLTQRQPPKAARLWHHDATVGDFRDSALGRSALVAFRAAVTTVTASHAIFPSPALFAPSMANRDRLKHFFGEVATAETVGATRVWVPDGLWEPRVAVHFASELGVVCAIDPLVYDPGNPGEVYEDLEAPALYFRVGGLGRAGAIRSEKLEDLAALVEHYQDQDIDLTIAFASPARWTDARNFKKLLEGAA